MPKKYTVLFFLTLASLTMLVFAVLPHHHHEEYICFNTIHCEDEGTTHQHSHDDSPFNDKGGCVRNLFQTQVSRIQSLEHSCTDGHCHHFTRTLFLMSDILTLLSLEAETKIFPQILYEEKLHSACYTSDLSGRAPPSRG